GHPEERSNEGSERDRRTCRFLAALGMTIGVYSYRRASTGSNLDARMAGSMPNTTPARALQPRARTIAIGGVDASIGVALRMRRMIAPPTNRPAIAPTVVSVAASTRNCQRIARRVAPN